MDMIISATIKTIYQKGQTGKIVKTGKIKYNVYNHIKYEEFDIKINGKKHVFDILCKGL